MMVHRLIRLVCLVGAVTAPVLAAFICRFISRIAVKRVFPHPGSAHLPSFTETWVTRVADGGFPLLQIAFLLSVLVAGLGFYILLSRRLSTDAVASAFAMVCCFAYASALVTLGSTMLAIVLPFLTDPLPAAQ